MAIFKCKMCGGSLEVTEDQVLATCEYCGTQQTLPKVDNEKKLALFNRANNLRIKSEFDKAAGIYESIVAEFPEEAEAYWGLVLCKYGIEYVDDKDGSKIPTCHRTLPTSIMKDEDFQQACENADISAKILYRDEAKAIDSIQKKILEIASTEAPYDIFICYKETDDVTGARTEDSTIAQDIYTALTEMGYKVFFARNSLRKVAGTEYEPYIYAALSSAKVMLAIGTKYEYYDAVWVKNEWSRFISMVAINPDKILVPCYKNMDAYDIPEEFSNMQALDMADMMFFNSLEASVKRILPIEANVNTSETPAGNNGISANIDSLLKRVFMFLEDGEWQSANEYCEKVLDIDPENAKAYLGKLMVDLKIKNESLFDKCCVDFEDNKNYKKVIAFGDDSLKNRLKELLPKIKDEIKRKDAEAKAEAELLNALAKSKEFIIKNKELIKYNGSSADVVIPKGITSIGEEAFYENKTIKTVVIPDSVISIGKRAFSRCSSLKSIDVHFNNTNFSTVDGVLFNKDKTVLIQYLSGKSDTSYTIPDSVISIGECAFYKCKSLTSITIPDSVISIGEWAFYLCENLSSIIIPDSVTSIGEWAFYKCRSLTSITIPDSVISIGEWAFYLCENLTSVIIPYSLKSIGSMAFDKCKNLTFVTISGSETDTVSGAVADFLKLKGLCQHCGGGFIKKGLFGKKCSKCGKPKDY